jgi:hypothetical protein
VQVAVLEPQERTEHLRHIVQKVLSLLVLVAAAAAFCQELAAPAGLEWYLMPQLTVAAAVAPVAVVVGLGVMVSIILEAQGGQQML